MEVRYGLNEKEVKNFYVWPRRGREKMVKRGERRGKSERETIYWVCCRGIYLCNRWVVRW